MTRLRLLGRHDCELCEELHAVMAGDPVLCGYGIDRVDLDDVPALRERYQYSIPVVLTDDDSEIWAGPATESTLVHIKAALAG